jgi:hypothetical protein
MNVRGFVGCLALCLAGEGVALAQQQLPSLPEPAQGGAPAQNPEPAVTPPATPVSQGPVAPGEDGSWRFRYGVARERLLAGDFADAADRFDVLVGEAGDPHDKELAASMRDLARSWSGRGLALVKRNALGETPLTAKSVGERTTDEIAQLYANSITYGIGSGLWVGEHTRANNASGVVLPMLLFSGAAAGTVALLDIGHPLRYGVPQSIVSGMYFGFEEGLLLSLWNQSGSYSSHWQDSAVADVIWVASTAGAVGGGLLGSQLGTTPGRASFVGSAALWSGAIVGLVAAAATSDGASRGQTGWLAADVGLNAGALGGLLAASPVSPSIARVRFLDIGGVAGGLLGAGLYWAAANNNTDAQAFSGVTALGIAGGLTIAWFATQGMPADRLDDPEKPTTARTALDLQPTLAPVQGGATLGVAGLL